MPTYTRLENPNRLAALALTAGVLLTACQSATPTSTPEPTARVASASPLDVLTTSTLANIDADGDWSAVVQIDISGGQLPYSIDSNWPGAADSTYNVTGSNCELADFAATVQSADGLEYSVNLRVGPSPEMCASRLAQASATPAATPTPAVSLTPESPPTTIAVGVFARVIEQVNFREQPTISGQLIRILAADAVLEVVGGPTVADSLTWWQLKDTDGRTGWSAAQYLAPTTRPGARPTTQPTIAPTQATSPATTPASPEAQDLLNRINALRAQNNLPPYSLNDRLSQAALRQSQDMARTGNISHTGSDGSSAAQRIRDTGYPAVATGENIYGGASLDDAYQFWSTDPDHRPSLLSSQYKEIGVGIVKGSFLTYFTLTFGAR